MKVTLKLPRLSMNMEEATIANWEKKVGDAVQEGEVLYSIETEKVTADVESTATGKLAEILAEPGADIEVGDPVCTIEVTQ